MHKKKIIEDKSKIEPSKFIPENFSLGGVDWLVIRMFKNNDGVGNMGDCSDITNQIRLVSEIEFDGETMKIPLDKQEETFYHELSHAILMQMRHKEARNEHFVQCLGTFLYQFFKTAVYTSEICNPVGFKLDNPNTK
jgi:hypothetical protein